MRRGVGALVALGGLALAALPTALAPPPPASAADLAFPWEQDFSTAQGGVLSGDARILDGRLRLTDDLPSQAGSWATTDTFPSTDGLEIEFDYAMYSDGGGLQADGLLLYLADGAAAPGVGARGAGLGYSCVRQATQGAGTCDVPGVPGGFAAVALDRYGNFSLPINGSGPGARPDSVVVRGSGDGLSGYRYVTGVLAPGGVGTSGTTTRKVRVTLLPGDDGELAVTVRIAEGVPCGPSSTPCPCTATVRRRCRPRSDSGSPGPPGRPSTCTRSTTCGSASRLTCGSSTPCRRHRRANT